MRPPTPPGGTPPGRTLLARAALALYPPSWRTRYGDEVRALLEDSGGGLAAVASVAAAAIAAAGPGLALRRLRPRGPALRLAAVALFPGGLCNLAGGWRV